MDKSTDELSKHGLFFDYLYNLRVLDPNVSNETAELKEKSGEYSESKELTLNLFSILYVQTCEHSISELHEFRKIIDEFIGIAEAIVTDVEHEKSRAIAAQNLLKSMARQRESEQQDIQV